jgi:uncharacterized membrane protein
MSKPDHPHRLEHWVHLTLLGGLLLSGVCLIVGLCVALLSGQPRPEGMPPPFWDVLLASFAGNGAALIEVGLLLLIATPIMRVAVLALGWGLAGNRRFMAVSLVVLALLLISFFLGVG